MANLLYKGIPINETQCIGDSLETFNDSFIKIKEYADSLTTQLAELSAAIYKLQEVAISQVETKRLGNDVGQSNDTSITPGRYISSLRGLDVSEVTKMNVRGLLESGFQQALRVYWGILEFDKNVGFVSERTWKVNLNPGFKYNDYAVFCAEGTGDKVWVSKQEPNSLEFKTTKKDPIRGYFLAIGI